MRRKVKEGGGAVSGVAKDKKRVKSEKSLARHVAGNGSKITGATSSSCDALLSKLNSARFRYISEQLYTKSSEEGMLLFQSDPQSFKAYHKGYGIQMKKWPCQPIIDVIQSLKAECNGGKIVIADMGCGDARIARDLNGKAVVHSFDFMAINEDVVVCDMAKVPLPNGSCDVVVFCLSLMGTNLTDFVFEANRILKVGGRMKIAEITSRFYSIKHFVVALAEFGFDLISKRLKSDGYFIIFNFSKAKEAKKKRNRWLKLKPCVYKKR